MENQNNPNNINKTQLVLLILLSSFVISTATGIIVVALAGQNAASSIPYTLSKIVQKTIVGNESAATTQNNQDTFNFTISEENTIVKIVEKINPAVVSIIATKDIPVIEQYFVNPFDDGAFNGLLPSELLPDFQVPQFRQKGTEKKQISSGTGFFVSQDGLILTNKHVVEDLSADYSVIMNNGKTLKARVLGRDKYQDIAILKIDGGDYSFIPIGNSDNLKVGQTAIAIGNALGEFQNTVSVGVISGLKRNIVASGAASGPEKLQSLIQTDAAINPGNSGGPLLDSMGRAVGINTAVASGAQSIGFALPINIAKKDIEDVKKFNRIKIPFLGVRYIIITPDIKEKNKLAVDYGALVAKGEAGEPAIAPGSPAEHASLREGDIILTFNGKKIDANTALADMIRQKTVGNKVNLKILRDRKEINLKVTIGEMPE